MLFVIPPVAVRSKVHEVSAQVAISLPGSFTNGEDGNFGRWNGFLFIERGK